MITSKGTLPLIPLALNMLIPSFLPRSKAVLEVLSSVFVRCDPNYGECCCPCILLIVDTLGRIWTASGPNAGTGFLLSSLLVFLASCETAQSERWVISAARYHCSPCTRLFCWTKVISSLSSNWQSFPLFNRNHWHLSSQENIMNYSWTPSTDIYFVTRTQTSGSAKGASLTHLVDFENVGATTFSTRLDFPTCDNRIWSTAVLHHSIVYNKCEPIRRPSSG